MRNVIHNGTVILSGVVLRALVLFALLIITTVLIFSISISVAIEVEWTNYAFYSNWMVRVHCSIVIVFAKKHL